jgi:TonB family protein
LIILDGIPITKAAMDQLDPETFQSISVLKEKSATAVFGERAKNGVILITTKGKAAKGTGAKSGNEEVVVVGYGQTPSGETPPPSKVAIRSTGSFDSANPPLFILDGVPITKAEMDLINPSQIASINVIKDKSATDSYGVKATNGVIIIVTKGKESNIKQLFGNYSEQMVEVMPQFPGGQQALNDFLAGVIEYPAEAVKKNIQGRVMVTFTVKSDGTVGNAKISQGIHPLLDNEAIRVVNMSPNWTPGKYKGLPVTASYTIPVQFALDGGKLDKQKVMAEMKAPPQRPDGVFVVVEEMPEFPGKELALREFIAKTIKYPADAMKDSIQGKVFVTFVVKADGTVGDAKIARGVHPSLDQEALRVVSALPTWKPGKQRGVAVNVSYTIPVQFSLKGDKNAQQIWLSPPSQKVPTQRPDGVYVVVEEMPEFPGGPLALREFIAKTVEYPADAMKDSIQGKVFVTFVVKADGTIGDSKVARGVHPSLDNEAIRVVYALPTWKPGKQGGKAVDVSYTVPIQFTLQSKNVTQTVSYVAPKINGKGEKEVFIVVEEMPEFPGGSQALRSFVAKSIRYPAEAQKEKAQGKVFVSFVVSSTGKVKNAKIERSVSPALDAEAIRVVNQLPDWKPGKQRGKAVSVEYTIPIEFKLQ